MAKADDILTTIVNEIRSDGLLRVVDSEPGLFSPRHRPEIVLKPGSSNYRDLRNFMLDTYSRMLNVLKGNGDHFSPELFFGPGRARKISLGFNWQSLRIDEFEFQKEVLWTGVMDSYYDWSAQEKYLLISGEYPQTL